MQFVTFKKKLFTNYIKKGKEPKWNDLPQVKPYWKEFKQYKLSEEAQGKSEHAKSNASKKKYSHHLGAGGYKKAVRKWQKMEQGLMDRDIRSATWECPDRSMWWLFANGVTLNQLDGTLVMPEQMQEVSHDLVTTIDEAKQGTFQPQRENDVN